MAGAGFFVFFLLLIGFLKSLFDFLGPLVEDLLIGLTETPVSRVKFVDKRLVNIVDNCVQGEYRVLADLTKQYLVVIGTIRSNGLARGITPHEINTFAFKLKLLAYIQIY